MSDGEGQGFVHLRVRSAYSLLEGAIKADQIGKLAAAAGISEADYANLYGQVETDLQENLSIIDTNLVNQKALVQTGAQADISRLDAQRGNPFLSAILGGLQGAQTGLSIASLGQSIGAANRVADPNLTAGQQASIT